MKTVSRTIISALAFMPALGAFRLTGNLAVSCSAATFSTTFRKCDSSMSVTNGVIIGGGRIGSYLHELNGKKDRLIASRKEAVSESDPEGPIYVCTRNDDLESIIANTPARRHADLVFLQNGILTPYLLAKGLQDNTQGLIYFAISKKGEKPIDGVTDVNPEGLTSITGKWASDFAERLHQGGLSCHVLDKTIWTIKMLEKHIWISAFMAVGVKYGTTVGDVESKYNQEVRGLIAELAAAATQETGVAFLSGLGDRLCAYSRSVAHYPTALKETKWRNGWFLDISSKAKSKGLPDPCPAHSAILSNLNT